MKIGPYQITGELGRGGMGVVLRGRAPDGRDVAIKVLSTVSREMVTRFDRERRLLGSLREADGFVPLLDAGVAPRGPYIVMPLVTGGTLRDRLVRGALGEADAVAVGGALARALGKAHAAGIVHRDLKPENVLFTDDGRALLADLGIAKHFSRDAPGASHSVSLSRSGTFRGTAGYMAPEQMKDAKSVGPAADQFALGAIVYECLAGEPAYSGESLVTVMRKLAAGEREPLATRCPGLSPALVAAVERALALDPSRRFPDALAFASALDTAAAGGPGATGARRPPRARPSRVAAALGGAASLIVLVGGLLVGTELWPAGEPSGDGSERAGAAGPNDSVDDRPSVAFPAECAGFLRTDRTVLRAVFGRYPKEHSGPISTVAFLPDGRRIISGSVDRTVRIFDVETGEQVALLGAHDDDVSALAVAADGRRALSAAAEGDVRLWDLEAGALVGVIVSGEGASIRGLALSPDGRLGIVAREDEVTTVWDLDARAALRTLDDGQGITVAVAFSPDGRRVLTGGADAVLRLWDVETGRMLRAIEGHVQEITAVAFSPDGLRAVSNGLLDATRVWDLTTGEEIQALPSPTDGPSSAAAIAPDGRSVLISSFDKNVRQWSLETGEELRVMTGHEIWVRTVAVGPDGRRAVSGAQDGAMLVWDLETGEAIRQIGRSQASVRALAVTPDGRRVIAADSFDGKSTWIWELERPDAPVGRLLGHEASVPSVDVSADGTRAVTGSFDGTVRLWDLESGARNKPLLRTFAGHVGADGRPVWVNAVAFHPDGRRVVSGGYDDRVRLWDLESGEQVGELLGHTSDVYHLEVSGDGRVISTSADSTIRAWNPDTGEQVTGVVGHPPGGIPSVALLDDGWRVVTGGGDGSVRLWELRTPAPLRQLGEHGRVVLTVAASPDERLVVATGEDRTIGIYRTGEHEEPLFDRIDLASSEDFAVTVAWIDARRFIVGTVRGVLLLFEVTR